MDARCPACTAATGRTVSREVLDTGGLSVTFECEECDEQWDVVF